MTRVLVVATSRKTRGGITSVVKAHETGDQWQRFHCHWVQTHRDGPMWRKFLYLGGAMIDFLLRVPFCDIVHIHISQPTTIKRKRPFLMLAKALKKIVLVHFHAYNVEDTISGAFSCRYAEFFNAANKILVLSEWWKEQMCSILSLPSAKIEVLYNPCPMVKRLVIKQTKSILYAGTVTERKGYGDLIKAFARIADRFPGWRLKIAGNGDIARGRELAKSLGVDTRVDFLGWVSGETKEKTFREAAIFCLPSYAEGFPMAVLDAWAYGLPVITTPVGGIPDVAKDGENMLLFAPGDIDALSYQLECLICDENLRNKISYASLSFSQNGFNHTTINQQLERIYIDLLD